MKMDRKPKNIKIMLKAYDYSAMFYFSSAYFTCVIIRDLTVAANWNLALRGRYWNNHHHRLAPKLSQRGPGQSPGGKQLYCFLKVSERLSLQRLLKINVVHGRPLVEKNELLNG